MTEHSADDDDDNAVIDWNSDDDREIDNNLQWSPSPSPSPLHSNLVPQREHSASDDEMEIDNFQWSPSHSNSVRPVSAVENLEMSVSDETVARLIDMGFSDEMIARAVKETDGENSEPGLILETLVKYSADSGASSSGSKLIDELISMGFSEKLVIKFINEYGEENVDEITNALLSYAEAEKLCEAEGADINNRLSDEENELNSSDEDSTLQALIKMEYSREEASIAIERCGGENASVADVIDLISAARLARQFDEYFVEPIHDNKKRRVYNDPPKRGKKQNTFMASNDDDFIRLPNPMIGFGLPDGTGLKTERPDPIPATARGPPYFYYENVALAPKGVWAIISKNLYNIKPEFVDSMYFCAAMRKRGYVHNLPIKNRFQIQPLPHQTIQDVLPMTRKWWPSWDKRTKLNCLLTCVGSAKLTDRVRIMLEKYNGETPPVHVQKAIIDDCKRWNLIWVGKNKLSPLEPDEIEKLLGFPRDHTRGGGVNRTDRFKSLGNSFQVDTVAYHLSVLKPLYPDGIKVLSLFTGIGGGEVALHRLGIRMKVVVSVEISDVNQNILRSFWEQTSQEGVLEEISDVKLLDTKKIEQLMDKYGGFDLVIGGSPCNNLAGGNRSTRTGLEGEHSQLFFDYCRILDAVRSKAARMRRGGR